jgi:E3 ubiquitin-protein ligase RNF13
MLPESEYALLRPASRREEPAAARGLSSEQIEAYPTHCLGAEESGQASARGDFCSVCLEGYDCGHRLRTLPCLHRYHAACIDPWLSSHGSCPVCKSCCT